MTKVNKTSSHRYYGLNKEQARDKREQETFTRIPVSFYRYVKIDTPQEMQKELLALWREFDCLGRIYIAQEGINAQMSVPKHHWDQFKKTLYAIPEFANIPFKFGLNHERAFIKLKVKVRKQIVADGLTIDDYDIENVGNHLSAKEWNAAMESPETVVVDMRNHYESEIGHFENALTPQVDTFREELPAIAQELHGKQDAKVLLYCTGGIRCEKASAYLKHQGFKDVNQLHGGIIDYKHQIDRENLPNKFKGSNYVFDERGREQIGEEIISRCHGCNNSCDRHVNCANQACNLLFLQCDQCQEKTHMTCSKKCQKVASLPEQAQKKYYQKYGHMDKRKFSKSLDARKKMYRTSPWQKIIKMFQNSQ